MSCTVCGSGGDNVGDGDVLENSVDVGDNEDELEGGEEVDSPEKLVVSKT
jgi:hypothetical protein